MHTCMLASQVVKNLPAVSDPRDAGLIPGLERFPAVGNGNPLQYSCCKIPWTEKLGGLNCSSWGCRELDTTERPCMHTHTCIYTHFHIYQTHLHMRMCIYVTSISRSFFLRELGQIQFQKSPASSFLLLFLVLFIQF